MEEPAATTPSPAPPQQQQQPDLFTSPPRAAQQPQPVRILGRNVNGTVVQTSMPQNEAELQLYRVMQRASLLGYYDTLLEMGGDDVQQLCDAGEEEFLEIMALTPVIAPAATSSSKAPSTPVAFPCLGGGSGGGAFNPRPQLPSSTSITAQSAKAMAAAAAAAAAAAVAASASATPAAGPQQHLPNQPAAVASSACCPVAQRRKSLSPPPPVLFAAGAAGQMHAEVAQPPPALSRSPGIVPVGSYDTSSCGSQGTTPSPTGSSAMLAAPPSPTAMLGSQTTPVLLESQVQRLAEAAERLAASLRPLNPKPSSGVKKKMCKNLEMVMAMPDSEPRRMQEIRKYAAIYGRFDCKRKPEKPLTLHEVSVNEAAAQICRFVPALLTRRDELFPLARRVVRDSGHYYTKGLLHTSSSTSPRAARENGDGELSAGDEEATKRRKLDDEPSAKDAESAQQADSGAPIGCLGFARSSLMAIDSDSNSMHVHRNRHRKRQRRRRPIKLLSKSLSSPVWQSCSDNSSIVLDGIGDGLEESNDCYSSFEEDWDDCNEDDCDNNFGIESDEAAENDGDEDIEASSMSRLHDEQNRLNTEDDDVSCMTDKENDFNLKVIASCGDNIIAVANPALMSRANQQPAVLTKEPVPAIKEEILLRDKRD
ncbi:NGFI-A-binding protein homolog isoform X2 [Phymastichus coffea]|uniref:NGFI-A-binding protein homolog isoform X2 n=1 Tax=Phymastichus coffea TaxID=108790 RepID=UPI00273B6E75|nr:NGFI-A-binding protein homolog isoform X2 [Phymastichus coffea]